MVWGLEDSFASENQSQFETLPFVESALLFSREPLLCEAFLALEGRNMTLSCTWYLYASRFCPCARKRGH